jgi:hypothetical protein
MRHYKATNLITAEVVEYDADLPRPEHLTSDWRLEDVIAVEPSPDDPPPPPPDSVKITKLAFRNRFTQTEKVTIEIAALDNPAADMQTRGLAASLRANQQDIMAAQFIDLMYADTRAGVQALETYGLIGAGRAAEILDTEPTADEVFDGN